MKTSHTHTQIVLAMLALLAFAAIAFGQTPPNAGLTGATAPSDQKPGSMLVYNVYHSVIGDPSQNTRFNITNTHPSKPVNIHLFFVRKSDCTIADTYFCLTANHTVTFSASEADPGEMGFMFLVATNANGCPISHNYLIGDEYIKSTFGSSNYYQANLGAEAFTARKIWNGGAYIDWAEDTIVDPYCYNNGTMAAVAYGEYHDVNTPSRPVFLYDEIPVTLAVDNVQSPRDKNNTLLVLHSTQGSTVQAGMIGSIAGQVYNDKERGYSYQVKNLSCLETRLLNDSFIRIPYGFSNIIPSGQTGWMYFNSPANPAGISDLGLLGATLVANAEAGISKSAFNGGHNLHFLKVKANPGFAIPVFMTETCNNF